jgi:hypothetical protein
VVLSVQAAVITTDYSQHTVMQAAVSRRGGCPDDDGHVVDNVHACYLSW